VFDGKSETAKRCVFSYLLALVVSLIGRLRKHMCLQVPRCIPSRQRSLGTCPRYILCKQRLLRSSKSQERKGFRFLLCECKEVDLCKKY